MGEMSMVELRTKSIPYVLCFRFAACSLICEVCPREIRRMLPAVDGRDLTLFDLGVNITTVYLSSLIVFIAGRAYFPRTSLGRSKLKDWFAAELIPRDEYN
jgi:hypothetical protein